MLLTIDNTSQLARPIQSVDAPNLPSNGATALLEAPRRLPRPTDHVEICPTSRFAGVSDRGVQHEINEDAIAMSAVEILVSPIDVPPVYIAVVCDGVSSSEAGDSASEVASQAAMKSLNRALTLNPDANARAVLRDGILKASATVCAIPNAPNSIMDPPATTIVAAVVQDSNATIAWIGDSRAYWVTETDCGLLTRDDSWVNAMIDAGRMTEAEAINSPNVHALFKCLGREHPGDSGTAVEPSFVNLRMTPGMRLVLCSDGFWNYAPGAQEVAKLVRHTPLDNPLKTARHLVNFAIVGGGHDNISVVVLAV